MEIIFGKKAKVIATELLIDTCPNCKTQTSFELFLIQRYVHIFWIPFIPDAKIARAQCSHCKEIIDIPFFTGDMFKKFIELKQKVKAPLWVYTGLIIMLSSLIFALIFNQINHTKNSKIILEPQKEDVYEIQTKNGNYSLFKVENVIGDTVYILIHKYETDNLTGLRALKDSGEDGYSNERHFILKKDLKLMFDHNELIDIDRKISDSLP